MDRTNFGVAITRWLCLGMLCAGCTKSPCADLSEPILNGEKCLCKDGEEVSESECEAERPDSTAGAADVVFSAEVAPNGDWLSDNQRVHGGEVALHTPALDAGDTAEMTFDCGAAEHTQLSVYLLDMGGSETWLELQVDGAFRGTFARNTSSNRDFRKQVIDVSPGSHTYTFHAETSAASDKPAFFLDAFECRNAPPTPGPNGYVDFDDGFVPVELGGEWFVDNLVEVHEGQAAVRAPAMAAGDDAELTFDCADVEHTQLVFSTYDALGGANAELDLFVDDVFHGTFEQNTASNRAFLPQFVSVEPGAHVYKFVARATAQVASPFALDSFQCRAETPDAGPNGYVDFDDGFLPVELTGGWFVDNLAGVHQGQAAARAPALEAGDEAEVTFDCAGVEHAKLTFSLLDNLGGAPAELDLYVDGDLHTTFPQNTGSNRGFLEQVVVSEEVSAHSYRFVARATEKVGPPFVLDTFHCE